MSRKLFTMARNLVERVAVLIGLLDFVALEILAAQREAFVLLGHSRFEDTHQLGSLVHHFGVALGSVEHTFHEEEMNAVSHTLEINRFEMSHDD